MPKKFKIEDFNCIDEDLDSYAIVSKHLLSHYIGFVLRVPTVTTFAYECNDSKLLDAIEKEFPRFKGKINYCFLLGGGEAAPIYVILHDYGKITQDLTGGIR